MTKVENATVLIVDDEEEILEPYALFLAEHYEVRTATGGDEALEKVDDAVDVVLLDRRMPDMTGDEVLAELRARGYHCQVAMLTGVEPKENIVNLPFDHYEVKPVGRAELVALVEVLLERSTYDEKTQHFFRLAAKKAALEIGDQTGTEAYEEIVSEMGDLRSEINGSLDAATQIGLHGEFAV